jgi:hypothetical protein
VCANLGTLFQQADAQFFLRITCKPREVARSSKSGRAATDDNDVKFHAFAFYGGGHC